jgi:hypothetical protein
MTIEQAANQVKEVYSNLSKVGDKWKFQIYNHMTESWIDSPVLSWKQANYTRSRRMAELGRELMGLEPTIYIGGNWQQYLKP